MRSYPMIDDHVICTSLPTNLGKGHILGDTYVVLGVYPKVRVTPGTGDYFVLAADANGQRIAFNIDDIRLTFDRPDIVLG